MQEQSCSTAAFLRLIHGDKPIHFRAVGPVPRNLNGKYETVQNELTQLNREGNRICFTVNAGGTKKTHISAITSLFADFDAQSKEEAMRILSGFEHWPTVIVESKRSLHPYWVLEEPYIGEDRIAVFETIQKGLIATLGSDERVWTAERIMALPGYLHLKDPSDPFLVHVREVSGTLYRVADFATMRSVGERICDEETNWKGRSARGKGGYKCDISRTPSHLYPPLSRSIETVVQCREEAIGRLLQVDLTAHLGVTHRCCCPLHDDASPSASIYQAHSGDWLLHCHAGCGTHNIVDLTAFMYAETISEAVERLMAQYRLKFDDSWLKANLAAIDPATLKQTCPVLFRSIHWYLPALARMNELVAEHYSKLGHVDHDGNPCMMLSYRYLSDAMEIPVKRLQRRLTQLAGAGLLNTLTDYQAPEELLGWAERQKKELRRASIWSIPRYSTDLLADSEAQALRRREMGETAASRASREAQQRAYGTEEAKRICPMAKADLHLSEAFERLKAVAKSLIADNGFYRDADALQRLGWKTEGGKNITKVLRPAIIKELSLIPLQLNAMEKQRLSIAWAGYPRVWVQRVEDSRS